jgi:hypothetical protein
MCGALGRASVIPAPRTKGAQDHVDLFHREGPEPRESWIQKGERQILCAKAAQGHVRYGQCQETAAVSDHPDMFADEGDSGSVVVNSQLQIVGLLMAATTTGKWGIANRIENVFDKLRLKLA